MEATIETRPTDEQDPLKQERIRNTLEPVMEAMTKHRTSFRVVPLDDVGSGDMYAVIVVCNEDMPGYRATLH